MGPSVDGGRAVGGAQPRVLPQWKVQQGSARTAIEVGSDHCDRGVCGSGAQGIGFRTDCGANIWAMPFYFFGADIPLSSFILSCITSVELDSHRLNFRLWEMEQIGLLVLGAAGLAFCQFTGYFPFGRAQIISLQHAVPIAIGCCELGWVSSHPPCSGAASPPREGAS